MSKEITEQQLVRVLLDISRIIDLGTTQAEQAGINPPASQIVWNKENQRRWKEELPRLLDMASAGKFSEVLDALHEGLKLYRDDSK